MLPRFVRAKNLRHPPLDVDELFARARSTLVQPLQLFVHAPRRDLITQHLRAMDQDDRPPHHDEDASRRAAAPNDGAVFCTGSIAYGQALPANGFDNSAAKVLANVVDAFLKPGKLPGADWTVEEKQWR